MRPIVQTTSVALLGLALAGCFSGGSSSSGGNEDQTPGVTENAIDTQFIIAELANTTDDRDPFSVNDREIRFDDQQAIDALF